METVARCVLRSLIHQTIAIVNASTIQFRKISSDTQRHKDQGPAEKEARLKILENHWLSTQKPSHIVTSGGIVVHVKINKPTYHIPVLVPHHILFPIRDVHPISRPSQNCTAEELMNTEYPVRWPVHITSDETERTRKPLVPRLTVPQSQPSVDQCLRFADTT